MNINKDKLYSYKLIWSQCLGSTCHKYEIGNKSVNTTYILVNRQINIWIESIL